TNGFGDIVHFELLRRDWKIDQLRARPFDRMVAHTGFITVAKRVSAARGEPLESGAEKGEDPEIEKVPEVELYGGIDEGRKDRHFDSDTDKERSGKHPASC
ncbi:MAG: hypothetical protein ABSG91_07930, partial [Syntrophobacteraceae bacterium]